MPFRTATFPTMRVALVDDDESVLRTLAAALKPMKVTIDEFSSAEAFLEKGLPLGPDLLVFDFGLPGKNGLALVTEARTRLGGRFVPAVMITGLDEHAMLARAAEAGVDDFLHKPFDLSILRARVTNLLRLKQYSDALLLERDQAHNDLKATREQLLQAERVAALGTLMGGVGHELNNLAAVLGTTVGPFTELTRGAADGPELVDDVRHVFNRLKSHAAALLRLSQGEGVSSPACELTEAVSRTTSMLQAVGKTKHLKVHVSEPPEPVWVPLTPMAAEQVVMNVLANAADACRVVASGIVTISLVASETSVELVVVDTGEGMDGETKARCFEPFFTTRTPGRGTGLGLCVVKQHVDQAHGTVAIESELGKGTTVRVKLPRVAAPQRRAS